MLGIIDKTPQLEMFKTPIKHFIKLNHEMVLLSQKIDWDTLESDCITNIEGIAQKIGKLIKPGGFLIFTGPYEYPIYYDPIDNGFRPEIEEVTSLFNNFKIIQAAIVTDYAYAYYLKKNKKNLFLTLVRVLTPFYKFNKWKNVVLPKFKWWNKQFKVTCVLM